MLVFEMKEQKKIAIKKNLYNQENSHESIRVDLLQYGHGLLTDTGNNIHILR